MNSGVDVDVDFHGNLSSAPTPAPDLVCMVICDGAFLDTVTLVERRESTYGVTFILQGTTRGDRCYAGMEGEKKGDFRVA